MIGHTLSIDAVAIIESLSANEKKTGKMLFDHIQAQGREATYLPVKTDEQFTNAIREVERSSLRGMRLFPGPSGPGRQLPKTNLRTMLWVDPFIEPEDPAAERLLLHLGMSRVGHRVLYQDSERLAFLLTIYGGRPKQSLMIPMVGIDDGGPHRTQI